MHWEIYQVLCVPIAMHDRFKEKTFAGTILMSMAEQVAAGLVTAGVVAAASEKEIVSHPSYFWERMLT